MYNVCPEILSKNCHMAVIYAHKWDEANVCIWTASCVIVINFPMTQFLVKKIKGTQMDGAFLESGMNLLLDTSP